MYSSLPSAKTTEGCEKIQEVLRMGKVAKLLADYVIQKGTVDEADRDMYEYSFTIGIEIISFALFCTVLAVSMHMLAEGILFFVIFFPLRSYAGGLHLERFTSCFCLSCLTYSVTLLFVKYFQIMRILPFLCILLSGMAVYCLYPDENKNRIVDEEEDKYFRTKLCKFLGLHLGMTVFFFVMEWDKYLLEIFIIYLMVVFTMVIGKAKGAIKSTE